MKLGIQEETAGDDVPKPGTDTRTEDLSTTSNPTPPLARQDEVMEMGVNIEEEEGGGDVPSPQKAFPAEDFGDNLDSTSTLLDDEELMQMTVGNDEEDSSNSVPGPSTSDSGKLSPQVTSIDPERTERAESEHVVEGITVSYMGSTSPDGGAGREEQPDHDTLHSEVEAMDEEPGEEQQEENQPARETSAQEMVKMSKLTVIEGMRHITEGLAEKVKGLWIRLPKSSKAKAEETRVKSSREVFEEISNQGEETPVKGSPEAFDETSNQAEETLVKASREVLEENSNPVEGIVVKSSQEVFDEIFNQKRKFHWPKKIGWPTAWSSGDYSGKKIGENGDDVSNPRTAPPFKDVRKSWKPTRHFPADVLLLMDKIMKEDFSADHTNDDKEEKHEDTSNLTTVTSTSDSGSTQPEQDKYAHMRMRSIYIGGVHKSARHGRVPISPQTTHTSESNTPNHSSPLLNEESMERNVRSEEEETSKSIPGPSTSDPGKKQQENHSKKKIRRAKKIALPSFWWGGDHSSKKIGEQSNDFPSPPTTFPSQDMSDTPNPTSPVPHHNESEKDPVNIEKEEKGNYACSSQTTPTSGNNPKLSLPLPHEGVMKKGNVRFKEDSIQSPSTSDARKIHCEDDNQSETKIEWHSFMEEDPIMQLMGMPQRFSYEDLSAATGGFSKDSKVGQGGFGNVYQGVLPTYNIPVAVKKIHGGSLQGQKEFMAEVSIISQLRHRNLIQILGWCKDVAKGTFLLVYELMPNGSLDKVLFGRAGKETACLSWQQRFNILTGTAAAVDYLHQGLKQQVIHRDIKSSNIMLDEDWNSKLGDFGLARLVDHQRAAARTMVAGTPGYIAPEVFLSGRFTAKTDVYSFGVLVLEVACGRRAWSPLVPPQKSILVNWVWDCHTYGNGDSNLLSTVDERLQDYDTQKMKVLLTVGLLCTRPDPEARPSMRRVVQMLAGDMPVPSIPVSDSTNPVCIPVPDSISIDDLEGPKTGSTTTPRSGLGDLESIFAQMTGRLEAQSSQSSGKFADIGSTERTKE